jgi:Mycothiol maleylpyruvate isomerase N-terminal domain
MAEDISAIITKRDLIASTTSTWDALVAYVDGVPDEQWSDPKDAAGWSVKDHVSHLTQ